MSNPDYLELYRRIREHCKTNPIEIIMPSGFLCDPPYRNYTSIQAGR